MNTGINFTSVIIKLGRTYLRWTSLARCRQKLVASERRSICMDAESLRHTASSLNSYVGQLRQVDGYKARKSICSRVESLFLRPDPAVTKIGF